MSKRVPVTCYINHGAGLYFTVAALCGQTWMGMVMSNDMAIVMRRALSHAEDCEMCSERWAVLCTPGTIVGVVGIGEPDGKS